MPKISRVGYHKRRRNTLKSRKNVKNGIIVHYERFQLSFNINTDQIIDIRKFRNVGGWGGRGGGKYGLNHTRPFQGGVKTNVTYIRPCKLK